MKSILSFLLLLSSAGSLMATTDTIMLKEVVVKAPLVRREADRLVLNVAADPQAANKDAQEILKTAPGVWATDESLSIYGQGGATVYIDDRKVNLSGPQLISYLKTIQSSSIANIEIIPKAGAEFGASSSGGVIRINLKRRRVDGINGSAGLGATIGEYKAWVNPFANVSLHSGRWTVNLSGNLSGSPSDRYATREKSDIADSELRLDGGSYHKQKALQGNVMLGVFCDAGEHDKVGLQVEYATDRNHSTASSSTDMISEASKTSTLGAYDAQSRYHNVNMAINYTHTLDDEGSALKWLTNYNHQYSRTDEDNHMQWLPGERDSIFRTSSSTRYDIFDSEVSLQKVFSSFLKLNAGVKYTHNDVVYESRHHNYESGEWVGDAKYDYDSKYCEDIAAPFVALNAQTGRWRFKAGVRGEYYHASGAGLSHSSLDLFPNANVAFNLTERGDYTVAVGYYRNIRRPTFWSLNPTVRQVSDYSYTVGNPGLRPSLVDAVSLDFVLAGRYTIAAGYSQAKGAIRQMFLTNPEHPERMYLSWDNVGKDRSGFLHGDGRVNLATWWNLYASLTYVVTSQQLEEGSGVDTFGYLQGVASMTFILPKDFTVTLSGFYQTRMKIGNITVYPILNVNPTVQKRFGKRCVLSLGVENLLQRTSRLRAESSGYDRLTLTKQHMAVRVGATYNFSSGKVFRAPRIEKTIDSSRLSNE